MLDKEFIPHQESLELVGLGYDEPVEFFKDSSEEIFDMRTPNDAPCILWQKAFRWFREKYEYGSLVRGRKSMGFEYILSDVPTNLSKRDTFQSPHVYKTYEEAELACLTKLIELVKNKQL